MPQKHSTSIFARRASAVAAIVTLAMAAASWAAEPNRQRVAEPNRPPAAETARHPAGRLPLPAARPEVTGQRSPTAGAADRSRTPWRSLWTVLGGLSIALGLFFLFAWLVRRTMPRSGSHLPREVVEVLGRATLAARQTVHLVRVGHKLLLVSVSTTGVETLTEITDPLEVDCLAGICQQSSHSSTSSVFRNVFQQCSREPTEPGFLDEPLEQGGEMTVDPPLPEEARV